MHLLKSLSPNVTSSFFILFCPKRMYEIGRSDICPIFCPIFLFPRTGRFFFIYYIIIYTCILKNSSLKLKQTTLNRYSDIQIDHKGLLTNLSISQKRLFTKREVAYIYRSLYFRRSNIQNSILVAELS